MVLKVKNRVKLPSVLDIPLIDWEELYEGLVADRYASTPNGEAGKSRLRPWAMVSGLVELYDYCRTLEADLRQIKSALPQWVAEGAKRAVPREVSTLPDEDLRGKVETLEARVEKLEQTKNQVPASRSKVLDI